MKASRLPPIRARAFLRMQKSKPQAEAVTGVQADITKATNGLTGQAHLVLKALSDIDQVERP